MARVTAGNGFGVGVGAASRVNYYNSVANITTTTVSPANGLCVATPIFFGCPIQGVKIGVEITGGGGVGSVTRLSLYTVAADFSVGDLIVDAGTVGATVGGSFEITINQLLPSVVWGCAVTQNSGAVPQYRGATELHSFIPKPSIAVTNATAYTLAGVTGAMPASGASFAPTSGVNTIVNVKRG